MNTNLFAIEILSAAHDAEQLKAIRQAQMPRAMCSFCATISDLLSRFFDRPATSYTTDTNRQAATSTI